MPKILMVSAPQPLMPRPLSTIKEPDWVCFFMRKNDDEVDEKSKDRDIEVSQ
jgi:hypothetical protein